MAFLILADGHLFEGVAVGAQTHALGELIFNTSQSGYQEILTDPSYLGQIINFTVPHIGNVGVNKDDYESGKVHAAGAIFRHFSEHYSNWRAETSLKALLLEQQIPALANVDTRALTLHLRSKGSQVGCLVADDLSVQDALTMAQNWQPPSKNLAALATTQETYVYQEAESSQAHIIVVDCGLKTSILKNLAHYPVKISVVPEACTFGELSALNPNGVLISNGPGDPEACTATIELARQLLTQRIPTFGICLGHQILALAAGAKTKKMKFGHHGANHPIQDCRQGTVFISSQNHGFVVDEASLPSCLEISHRSLFDGTIAGITHRQAPAFSFQGHPEANPGPNELKVLFKQFIAEVEHAKKHHN